jgi:hypothetical protein
MCVRFLWRIVDFIHFIRITEVHNTLSTMLNYVIILKQYFSNPLSLQRALSLTAIFFKFYLLKPKLLNKQQHYGAVICYFRNYLLKCAHIFMINLYFQFLA